MAAGAAIGLAVLGAVPASADVSVPVTPTELFNNLQACSTDANAPVVTDARLGVDVEGIPATTDPTALWVTEQFQLYPVSDPTQLITGAAPNAYHGNEAGVRLGNGTLVDGGTYAWQARSVDATGAASDWTAPCYLTVDNTSPAQAPTISSPNYPQGKANQGGAPIQLQFGANGVSDVAGYEFSWSGSFGVLGGATIGDHGVPQYQDPFTTSKYVVRADALGGSGTVSLIPPAGLGSYLQLSVVSLDRALNQSPVAYFQIVVKPDGPAVNQQGHSPQFGKPAAYKLTADPGVQAASPVVSFIVQHWGDQGPTTETVPASGNGTAVVTETLNGAYGDMLLVSTTSANGWTSRPTWWTSGYRNTTPTVASDVYLENGSGGGVGVPGTFNFTPKIKSAGVARIPTRSTGARR
ncbi:hypothetical protein C7C46_26925 [Streptomyces tateyamensis]|uniref:Uncharacterized protein n=1 Tax=Streptomyces tateyamensis TaxID=565073 RepID=A0A2V4NJ82_9ACTN|nr:hypothetical protein C7C46_26925 [Streptomyces tateyamensis]